jgi:hypothetical protein
MRLALALLVLACAACGTATPGPASTPTPTPVAGSPLGLTQLKFKVIDTVGTPAYCDPDYYPIAREGGEQASALTQYPVIKADAETYAAIVAHENLPSGELTDAQKLTLYRAWKLLRAIALTPAGGGYSFRYRIHVVNAGSAYQMLAGTVQVDGTVSVSSRTASGPPACPICLAATTQIATPGGQVRVTDLKPGMVVWTADASGARVAEPLIAIGSVEVPPDHVMVHLELADGRELLVSPGHPTADGRRAGELRAGDQLDGSTITEWELVPYAADRTYDILPAGGTGEYWANRILMGSTLAH